MSSGARHSRFRTAAVLGAVLPMVLVLATRPADAAVIVIDQDKALAGGITPGDAPGFPVEIRRHGHYRLGSPLVVPAGTSTAIEILVGDVTIDLHGFSISGGGASLTGINSLARGQVTIRNGTIRGFQHYGIQAPSNHNSSYERLLLLDNGLQGLIAGDGARIAHSTVASNGAGIRCERGCLIEASNIYHNGPGNGVGVQITSGMIVGSLIWGNRSFGIHVGALVGAPGGGPVGFGDNTLFENNNGGPQVGGTPLGVMRPNYCVPACP